MTGVQTCALPILMFSIVVQYIVPKQQKGCIKKKQKYVYETLGDTVIFALHNGFMPELEEWSRPQIVNLEAEVIEYLEKNGFRVDLKNRDSKMSQLFHWIILSKKSG